MMNLSRWTSLTVAAAATFLLASCKAPSDGTAETKASDGARADVAEVDRDISGKELINSIGMKLVRIANDESAMGSRRGNPDADLDERQHAVTIARDDHIGASEVTQAQHERLLGRNPSRYQGGAGPGRQRDHPVDQVPWNEALEFCRRLSEGPEQRAAGCVCRLPTKAEWEYACRAGNRGEHAFGDRAALLGDYGRYEANSGGHTHPVGEKKPNAWGLYDMHGNVWKWCADGYELCSGRLAIDPTGPAEGTDRVYRGGGTGYAPSYRRSANRTATHP